DSNQSEAARRLGVSRMTLLDKLKRHGLRWAALRRARTSLTISVSVGRPHVRSAVRTWMHPAMLSATWSAESRRFLDISAGTGRTSRLQCPRRSPPRRSLTPARSPPARRRRTLPAWSA
ncbi:MAG: hypothetical protein IPF99_29765, partial [Deltaproteobacteria bacterium]|nr:hypothetical protein [Deltaproteobacteria bacterium]